MNTRIGIRWFLAVAVTAVLLASAPLHGAGLVAHWTFDNPSARYADASGGGNDLAPVGSVGFTAGVVGDAMSVTGGGKANANLIGDLLTSEMTISLWADMADNWTGWDDFWALTTTGSHPSRALVLENAGGGQTPAVFNWIPGGASVAPGTPKINTGGYRHLVMTASTSANKVELFVDGNSVGSNTWAATIGASRLTFGGEWATGARNISTKIDEAQVYDRALSPEEVAYLYENPGAVVTAGDIPEPATLTLAGLALAGLGGYLRRRRKA